MSLALPVQAQDVDLSAFQDLDLSQFENIDPADLNIDLNSLDLGGMAAMSPLTVPDSGPPVPCTDEQDPETTGCILRVTYIFFQNFNARLAERVRSGPYNVSTYQYTRDCLLASSTISFDPFVGKETDEVLFDLRGIHNMDFWKDALYNLNHGHSQEDMMNELETGDTPIAEAFMSDQSNSTSQTRNTDIQSYYDNCDSTRSDLGGTREADAPSGNITASEYAGFR